MPARSTRKLSYHERFILTCLLQERPDKQDLLQEYENLVHIMGIPVSFSGRNEGWTFHRKLDSYLDNLRSLGLVNCEQGNYELTKLGEEEAERSYEKVKTRHDRRGALLRSPETASMISVCSNSAMALLKLTAGFIFNSMALIADGFDSLVDVVSAITVFLGLKHDRELISSTFIIVMMFGTAGYIAYEAVGRLISPEALAASPLAIAAAILSGGVCYLMSIYQHYVGKRSGSMSLLTQSVDSRNHTFQAIAVLTGLGFAAFGVFIVDAIVALLVAGLIFQSAIELLLETFRLSRGEELDTSRFRRKYEDVVSNSRKEVFKSWVLMALSDSQTREDIILDYRETFNSSRKPIRTAIQPMSEFEFEDQLEPVLKELEEDDLIHLHGKKISLTDRGKRLLGRKTWRANFGIPI